MWYCKTGYPTTSDSSVLIPDFTSFGNFEIYFCSLQSRSAGITIYWWESF